MGGTAPPRGGRGGGRVDDPGVRGGLTEVTTTGRIGAAPDGGGGVGGTPAGVAKSCPISCACDVVGSKAHPTLDSGLCSAQLRDS